MKKVLEMFGEPISYGGQESVVFNMLSNFDLNHGFKVDLFTPYFADNEYLLSLIKEHGGKVTSLGIVFKINDNRFKLRMPVRKFFANAKDYDVVHIHSGSLTTMCVFANEAKRVGIKKVIVHSHIANSNFNILYRTRRLILNQMMKNSVDVYLGCSKDALASKFINLQNKKSYIINNGIDISEFKFNETYRKEIRDKHHISDKFVIGSLGRISHQKNNKFMIDILDNIIKSHATKDIVLMMVGDGDDLNAMKLYAIEKKLDNFVIFTGNAVDSYKYYSAFDIFIMPSLIEGLPVTSIEAQTSGLKCLFSDNINHECSIAQSTEFISIDDADLWANKILEYKNNQNSRINNLVDIYKFDRNKTYNIVKDIYLD